MARTAISSAAGLTASHELMTNADGGIRCDSPQEIGNAWDEVLAADRLVVRESCGQGCSTSGGRQ